MQYFPSTIYLSALLLVVTGPNAHSQTCTTPTGNFTYSINNKIVTFTNSVTAATTWKWDFGDGDTSTTNEPTHTYPAYGGFNVCLTAFNACSQALFCNRITLSQPAVVTGIESTNETTVDIFPNPVHSQLFVSFNGGIPFRMIVINSLGETVLTAKREEIVSTVSLNFTGIAPGAYHLVWELPDGIHSRRIMKGFE
jgi:hypothetical protein